MSRPKTPKGETSYLVGRGKPPAHSQFKPGQSGNAGGRKKGVPNIKSIVAKVMTKQIKFEENGKVQTVCMLEAMVLGLAKAGLLGNARAITSFLELGARYTEPEGAERAELPQEDLAILETLRSAVIEHSGLTKPSDKPDAAARTTSSSRMKPRRRTND
jgi:hypothetical protein